MLKMKELPISERPYEKMEMYGESTLSNAELLAIIIKSGTKEESSVALAQKILSLGKQNHCSQDNLNFLQELTIQDLMQINGIGKVKAIQLKAVCELAKRIAKPIENCNVAILKPQDIVKIVASELQNEKAEILKVVLLSSKNTIIKMKNITQGNIISITVKPRTIIEEALKAGAPKVILIHNHPSGNPEPSSEDCKFTQKLEQAMQLVDMVLLDHIIIGKGNYQSIKSYMNKKGSK